MENTENSFQSTFTFLFAHRSLEKLDFNKCLLNEESLCYIFENLIVNRHLTSLNLAVRISPLLSFFFSSPFLSSPFLSFPLLSFFFSDPPHFHSPHKCFFVN